MTSYLFIYGTLLSGIKHPMHELLEEHATLLGAGYINGKLFDVIDYPALVLSNNTKKIVWGEIYQLLDEEMLFKYVDEYEGCAPHSPKPYEFQRDLVSIHDEQQHSLLAWTYLYKHPVGHLHLIPNGDYLAHRNKGRLRIVN